MTKDHHGIVPFKGLHHLCEFNNRARGRFGRMFDELPALYIEPRKLHELGAVGGPLEDRGLANLADDVPAGLIFFGQFVDHDITLDTSSSFDEVADPRAIDNVRSPTLDLDCIYGDGPEASPYLYDEHKLLTGADYADPSDPADLRRHDLPRNARGTAIIGDPRNDENRVISQLQLALLRFHNTIVDQLESAHLPDHLVFERARELCTWHYQWMVINEFLRTLCGDWIVDDILANGRRGYRPTCMYHGGTGPYIPVEFSVAAYRFGHSMIPQKLRVQPDGNEHIIFGAGSALGRGFEPLGDPEAVVDWEALFDSGNGHYSRAAAMDIKMASALLDLPFMSADTPAHERSLATRNLLRAQTFLLPSGEQIAHCLQSLGAAEITDDMIATVRDKSSRLGLPRATPLWLYLLAEGRHIGRMNADGSFSKGEGLGPVGARLVAEVLIGLMEMDDRAFLSTHRNWSPLDEGSRIGARGVTSLYELLTAGAA